MSWARVSFCRHTRQQFNTVGMSSPFPFFLSSSPMRKSYSFQSPSKWGQALSRIKSLNKEVIYQSFLCLASEELSCLEYYSCLSCDLNMDRVSALALTLQTRIKAYIIRENQGERNKEPWITSQNGTLQPDHLLFNLHILLGLCLEDFHSQQIGHYSLEHRLKLNGQFRKLI